MEPIPTRGAPPRPGRRRGLLLSLHALLWAACAALPARARAALPAWQRPWNADAFAAKGEPSVLAALGLGERAPESDQVLLEAPDIAESGAVVPVSVRSRLPGTRRIALLALDNPNTLAADFTISAGVAPRIATRIKLGATTTVVAVVAGSDGVYCARQVVKVTQGGCGG